MKQIFKTGQTAPRECNYAVIDSDGLTVAKNIHLTQGESFPQTSEEAHRYIPQDDSIKQYDVNQSD